MKGVKKLQKKKTKIINILIRRYTKLWCIADYNRSEGATMFVDIMFLTKLKGEKRFVQPNQIKAFKEKEK